MFVLFLFKTVVLLFLRLIEVFLRPTPAPVYCCDFMLASRFSPDYFFTTEASKLVNCRLVALPVAKDWSAAKPCLDYPFLVFERMKDAFDTDFIVASSSSSGKGFPRLSVLRYRLLFLAHASGLK